MSARVVSACGQPVRGAVDLPEFDIGTTCRLVEGHKGSHARIVFECDQCGRVRRGHAFRVWDPEGDQGGPLGFCFTCVKDGERDRYRDL